MAAKQGRSNLPYLLGTAILGGLVSITVRALRDRKKADRLPQWAEQVRRHNRKKKV
ncbi:hypothetical protein [Micrococcoides hystricis]|uniref:YtxH domain-containing protein n=1 Tax=Micrococcoides hystricis TaxID=1572761 RepID=A0ABV6PAR1_9MICC